MQFSVSRIPFRILGTAWVVLCCVLVQAPVPAHAAVVTKVIIQQNTDKFGVTADRAIQAANNSNAMAITLQEVCRSKLDELMRLNPGWAFSSVVYRSQQCIDGTDNMNVVIWRGGNAGQANFSSFSDLGGAGDVIPDDPNEYGTDAPGSMACLRFSANSRIFRVCSLHLWVGDQNARIAQAKDIKSIAAGWIANGESVILGGDFNAKPFHTEMDYLYNSYLGGNGRFTEYNRDVVGQRAGNPTARTLANEDKQVDYIFWSDNRSPNSLSGSARSINDDADSQHHRYRATGTVN